MAGNKRFLFSNLKTSTREGFAGYFFILPNLTGFLAFTSLPVLASLVLSFCHWDILTPAKFAGIDNFVKLIGFHSEAGKWIANDPLFWKYTWNTIFIMAAIPIGMFGSLMLAMIMNQKLKGMVFFRTIFFLPSICAGVAICLLWRWIYNPDFGLINSFIAKVGDVTHLPLRGPDWLSSTTWAKPALMIMGLWAAIGGRNMILYLAALNGIPKTLYEAAEIDGANGWHKFWAITFPLISPTTFFISIMSVIGGFQAGFMQAYIMTGGGPAGATTTINYYIYNNAYQWFKMGYASSIAWVLFIIILGVTMINWRYGGRVVNYD
ncbi:MAG: sugar ABC transporter permease [Candidatus Omnitrophica bacterium]|nr:sugar ABC transporter permease [Candidatus Omnitrophota bacterium]